MKKIDDARLLGMIEHGKTGKECAEYFGVSEPAISKRRKRLLPPPRPESFQRLSDKAQKFCLEVAGGSTQTEAALKSFDVTSRDSAKALGYQLMQKPEIERCIVDLLTDSGLSKRYRIDKLKQHIDNPSADISLRALDQSWKLDGSFAPVQINLREFAGELNAEDREIIRLARAKLIEGKAVEPTAADTAIEDSCYKK